MKKFVFLLFLWCAAHTAFAQLSGNNFYRVQNVNTERYLSFASKDVQRSGTNVDMSKAMISKSGFENVVSDPSTVVFISNYSGTQYDLKSQGIDSYELVGAHLTVTSAGSNSYTCSGSLSSGGVSATQYLSDINNNSSRGYLTTANTGNDKWYFKPINISGNEYFGLKPQVTVGSNHYASLYAGFAFLPAAAGMKVYYVKSVESSGVAVIAEVKSEIVPAGTPVIVKCPSSSYVDNRLDLRLNGGTAVSGNQLRGEYFSNTTAFDPSHHRVLGTASDGSLAFVKDNRSYLPANEAVLWVPAGFPDEMKVMTEEEWNDDQPVTINIDSYVREYGEENPTFTYTITGTPKGVVQLECLADRYSKVGLEYKILLKKNSLSNRSVTVNEGTLTITKATVTVKPADIVRLAGFANPTEWELEYSGFKNGEDESVLTRKPVVQCAADAATAIGERVPITVSGAEADNYKFEYEQGWLTVVSPVVEVQSVEREYGDDNPEFTYTPQGILNGVPVITCAADRNSPAGEYDILISRGTVTNEGIELKSGKLTVTKAPLRVSFSHSLYTMKQGQELPDFELIYTGFKNGEDVSALKVPVTVELDPNDMSVGEHLITLKDGESDCYSFVMGNPARLRIDAADPVKVSANNVTRVYGDPNPGFTYTSQGATLNGEPELTCEATASSPVGTYDIVVAKGGVKNYNDTYVNGTLTILPAPLTITAGTYTRKQGEENPDFASGLTYTGLKLNQTADEALTTKPTITCQATKESAPGEYEVVLSGAEAGNYEITYVSGKLIVSEADELVVVAENLTREYGEANPILSYTVSGAEAEGTPEISCEATATTPVGTYDIVVAKGTLANPNVKFTNGTLTIVPATLKVSVANYEREQGEENPQFTVLYEGWKNGETESVLLTKPVAKTAATKDSPVGEYAITVSGGEAQNYVFEYTGGVLTVKVPSGIGAVIGTGEAFDVYSVTGVLVAKAVTSLKQLPRGVYIINGKKVILK